MNLMIGIVILLLGCGTLRRSDGSHDGKNTTTTSKQDTLRDQTVSLIDTVDPSSFIERIATIEDIKEYYTVNDSSKISIRLESQQVDSLEMLKIQYGVNDYTRYSPAYSFFANPINRKIFYYWPLLDSLVDISLITDNRLPK